MVLEFVVCPKCGERHEAPEGFRADDDSEWRCQECATEAPAFKWPTETFPDVEPERLAFTAAPYRIVTDADCKATAVASSAGFLLTAAEWSRVREEIDCFYRRVSAVGLDELNFATFHGEDARGTQRRLAACYQTRWHGRTSGVYLIARDAGLYKIGRSSDVIKRYLTLCKDEGVTLTLIHIVPTFRQHEAEEWFHRHFAAKRTRGEWFTLTLEDVDWFRSLSHCPGVPR